VPSLLGVWYRGPFEHSGSCATLEDWFNPARIDNNYVPTRLRPAMAGQAGWRGPLTAPKPGEGGPGAGATS